jgi:hypothetical protein
MYRPIRIAIGIVIASVNAPQGDSRSAFTTTSATTRQQHQHDREHREQRDRAARVG